MKTFFPIVVVLGVVVACGLLGGCASEVETVDNGHPAPVNVLLQEIGPSRGICVVLGDARCKLSIQLARQTDYLIYTQLSQEADLEKARRAADKAGFLNTRIYVESGHPERLHLADNLADILITADDAPKVPEAEALRILRPAGKALFGDREIIKPFPEGIDNWSHPYHGPDNNPQSLDRLARAPYLTQFLADPRYGPLPQVAVASAGRVFKAFGHMAFKEREEEFLNTLVAFNGYNGAILWKRDISPGFMVHRNTIVATPTAVYFGDDSSCKVYDAETGELREEIIPPMAVAGGTFWKWMAIENGVLYSVIGEQELMDETKRYRKEKSRGWPWRPLSRGFDMGENQWGFGRNLLAIDLDTKKVLWSHHESEPIDCRAVCMKSGRIFIFRCESYLAAIDARTGDIIWRKTRENDPKLFDTIGPCLERQGMNFSWRTSAYLKCSDEALYFAGPQMRKLVAVSADDGSLLWDNDYENFQLVLRDDGLYGISGQLDLDRLSHKIDPLTGELLADIEVGRRACARPTGAIDSIFFRAYGGSTRLDLESGLPRLVSPMRPQCHDGVTIANGMLYWWPSTCDCNLTLYGVTCLGPAGEDFDFSAQATEAERLELGEGDVASVSDLRAIGADWPTFRANNRGSAATGANVDANVSLIWRYKPEEAFRPTPPVAVGNFVFISGSDGIVRAIDSNTGRLIWKAYTGGSVRIPPAIWNGRAFVGSGDGWMYVFEATTGRLLWRFRAAPMERKIPVYWSLMSTWPAASGVLVENATAYVAAGIVNYDGTHVYALDAETGAIKWQNNTSGHLDPEARTGVSVQGHLLLKNNALCMPGGNAVSPAIYYANDGRCVQKLEMLRKTTHNNVPITYTRRGWELYFIGDKLAVAGQPYYTHPKYKVYDKSVLEKTFVTSVNDREIVWVNNEKLMCFTAGEESPFKRFAGDAWGKLNIPNHEPVWELKCPDSIALAAGTNAVVVAMASEVTAQDLETGKKLWSHPLPQTPVPWGMAIDQEGRVIVSLENGEILSIGENPKIFARVVGALRR